MKKGYTHIIEILDRSGSMGIIKPDVIGGHNEFIRKQQELPGEATYTLVQFDHEYEVVQDFVSLKDARILTMENYEPRGSTALLQAMGQTIVTVGQKLAALPEDQRPENVIVAIYTDGEENHPVDYTKDQVMKMVKEQEEKYSWNFVYLSSDANAIDDAMSYGIQSKNVLCFAAGDGKAANAAYSSLDNYSRSIRGGDRNVSLNDN